MWSNVTHILVLAILLNCSSLVFFFLFWCPLFREVKSLHFIVFFPQLTKQLWASTFQLDAKAVTLDKFFFWIMLFLLHGKAEKQHHSDVTNACYHAGCWKGLEKLKCFACIYRLISRSALYRKDSGQKLNSVPKGKRVGYMTCTKESIKAFKIAYHGCLRK